MPVYSAYIVMKYMFIYINYIIIKMSIINKLVLLNSRYFFENNTLISNTHMILRENKKMKITILFWIINRKKFRGN